MKNNNYVDMFKNTMANYPTGVTVLTTFDKNNKPVGLTVNSFASVSIDPLIVLWSIDKGVSTYEPFSETETFAVNILAADQTDIAYLFASKEKDRFAHCEWETSEFGLPVLKDTIATLQCNVYKKIPAGDHLTIFGEIAHIDNDEQLPLLYHGRKLGPFPDAFHND